MPRPAPQAPAPRLDPYASVKTRGGLHVEIVYHTREKLSDGREIVGIITDHDNNGHPVRLVDTWFGDGRYYHGLDSLKDLVNP